MLVFSRAYVQISRAVLDMEMPKYISGDSKLMGI